MGAVVWAPSPDPLWGLSPVTYTNALKISLTLVNVYLYFPFTFIYFILILFTLTLKNLR